MRVSIQRSGWILIVLTVTFLGFNWLKTIQSRRSGPLIPVCDKTGRWGYIDADGRIAIDFQWELAQPFFDDDLAWVCVGEKEPYHQQWMAIDRHGKIVVPPKFYTNFTYESETIDWHLDGIAWVYDPDPPTQQNYSGEHQLWNLIDRKGHVLLDDIECSGKPANFDSVNKVSILTRSIEIREINGAIDITGELVIPFEWDNISGFSGQPTANATDFDNRSFQIDNSGNVVSDETRDPYPYFSFKTCEVFEANGKKGLRLPNGDVLLPAQYDQVKSSRSQEFMILVKDGKFGAVDSNGTVVVPVEWDYIWSSLNCDGMVVRKGPEKSGVRGFFASNGDCLIPTEWDMAYGKNLDGFSDDVEFLNGQVATRKNHPELDWISDIEVIKGTSLCFVYSDDYNSSDQRFALVDRQLNLLFEGRKVYEFPILGVEHGTDRWVVVSDDFQYESGRIIEFCSQYIPYFDKFYTTPARVFECHCYEATTGKRIWNSLQPNLSQMIAYGMLAMGVCLVVACHLYSRMLRTPAQ